MTLYLKQSTAIDIRVGPFVDATDAVTPETGITLAAADQAEVLKANGAATVAMAGAFAAVTGADGWYDYTVATGDVDTVGEVVFVVQDSSVCLPVFIRGYVVEEAVYDAMYGAASAGPLQSTTAARKLDVTATGAAGIDWANVENPATAVDLSATDIQLADTVTTLTGHTVQTGDSFARLGAPAAASIAADLLAIDNFVDGLESTIGVAGAGLGDLGGMSTAMQAEVLAEVNTALDTVISELTQGVPATTPTIRTGLMLMYMALRNKLDVATVATDTLEIHNDAGTRIAQKLLSDDGSDYSEAKMTSGA